MHGDLIRNCARDQRPRPEQPVAAGSSRHADAVQIDAAGLVSDRLKKTVGGLIDQTASPKAAF
jgi:hypothetical protein